MYKINSDFV